MLKCIFLIIIIIYILLSVIFSRLLQKKVEKYSKTEVESKKDTIETIKMILEKNEITNVTLNYSDNMINSFYDTKNKRLYLNKNANSLSSKIISFHELGHILQDYDNYKLLIIRNKILPLLNVFNILTPLLLIIGLLSSDIIFYISILFFMVCIISNYLTVLIEKDASKRGIDIVKQTNNLNKAECEEMEAVLNLSKITYIFSLFAIFNKFRRTIF